MIFLDVLKKRGYNTVPADFYNKIDTWQSWYDGNVKEFHSYKVFNGQKSVQCRRYTMGMAKKISEDWANLLLNEKVKITLEDNRAQRFVDEVLTANNWRVKANEMQELKAAVGTVAYVPRVTGLTTDGSAVSTAGSKIIIDYVPAQNIFPLSWQNGIIRECAFASKIDDKSGHYIYAQIHVLNADGLYDIENALYKKTGNSIDEVSLDSLPELSRVAPTVHTGSAERQFVIDRLNIANNYDITLPLGIAAFANAIDNLKGVDIAYDSYINEFVLGKKKVVVKPEAVKNIDGEPLFDTNELLFYILPQDGENSHIVQEMDFKLRTTEHNRGMQDMLNVLSSKCGFGENHYKYDNGSIATATQVISENSEMFRTVRKHETLLRAAITELCRIILRMGNAYFGAGLNEDVEISIDFDDSIIEDKDAEFNRDMRLLQAGIINDYEIRMKYLNEDEATARSALPGLETLIQKEAE